MPLMEKILPGGINYLSTSVGFLPSTVWSTAIKALNSLYFKRCCTFEESSSEYSESDLAIADRLWKLHKLDVSIYLVSFEFWRQDFTKDSMLDFRTAKLPAIQETRVSRRVELVHFISFLQVIAWARQGFQSRSVTKSSYSFKQLSPAIAVEIYVTALLESTSYCGIESVLLSRTRGSKDNSGQVKLNLLRHSSCRNFVQTTELDI